MLHTWHNAADNSQKCPSISPTFPEVLNLNFGIVSTPHKKCFLGTYFPLLGYRRFSGSIICNPIADIYPILISSIVCKLITLFVQGFYCSVILFDLSIHNIKLQILYLKCIFYMFANFQYFTKYSPGNIEWLSISSPKQPRAVHQQCRLHWYSPVLSSYE